MCITQLKVLEIRDSEIRTCLEELATVCRLDVSSFENMMLLHCFQNCIHPNGGLEKPVPIHKDDLDSHDPLNSFLLRKKTGKLENDLYQVCAELANIRGRSMDEFTNTALYIFLNKIMTKSKPKAKPTRWLADWQQEARKQGDTVS